MQSLTKFFKPIEKISSQSDAQIQTPTASNIDTL